MREYKDIDVLVSCQKINILGHFELFVHMEPIWDGYFKTLLIWSEPKLYDKYGSHKET